MAIFEKKNVIKIVSRKEEFDDQKYFIKLIIV
jgi:hypothetical protein